MTDAMPPALLWQHCGEISIVENCHCWYQATAGGGTASVIYYSSPSQWRLLIKLR